MGEGLASFIKALHRESERFSWGLVMWDLPRYLNYIREGMRVLEVGCHKQLLKEHVAARGASYVGVDITTYGAKIDVVCDGAALPFRDGAFDQVWSIHVVEHMNNPYGLFSEGRRVLRDGGLVIAQSGLGWLDPTHLYMICDETLRRLAVRANLTPIEVHRNAPNIATVVARK